MSDIKNDNIEETNETEEILEVALAEDVLESTADENAAEENNAIIFTDKDGGLSGLTEKQRRRNYIFDKITTGILILLLISPIAILSYIFLWFIFR